MKVGTAESMKFLDLRQLLGVPKFQVIGILEGLWYLTASNAPDGAIGKFSYRQIASWLEWTGEPEVLIDALVNAGFLDRCLVHNLVVHDWEEHCPTYIKGVMARQQKTFAKCVPKDTTKSATKSATKEPTKDATKDGTKGATTYSSLSNPSLSNSSKKHSINPDRFSEFWTAYPRRVAKKAAVRAWAKIKPGEVDLILGDIARRKLNGWIDPAFIPHPATYLNGRRWEDDPEPVQTHQGQRRRMTFDDYLNPS